MTSKSGSSVKAPEPNPRRTLQPETSRLAPGGAYQRIGGPPNSSGTGANIAGLYDLEETLGEGHYAVVKSARHVFTGERVAVKVIDKTKLDAATKVQMMQEVRLMKLVQHPHVVRLYEVIDTQTKLYLVLELADGGDMYDYIMRHENVGLDEAAARKYFRQIVQAIHYCHELHVVHRDLKPENVVFFQKLGLVKLTDFGFSNKFDPGEQLSTSCGSLAYSAPEILLGDAYDAPAVDVWSLGVILYMLVCGAAPFQEANDSETLTMIMDCKYSFPSHISTACKKLVSLMLQRQPHLRASLDDIMKDPWLNDGYISLSETIEDATSVHLPLVSREHLLEEEHSNIIQRMVNGNVAKKEDIIDALDCNEYNHITATYFLLAERKLRSKMINVTSPKKVDPNQIQKGPEVKTTEVTKPTKLNVSLSHAIVEPVIETVGAVASSTMTNEALTPTSNTPCEPFSIVNHPLLSPPQINPELSSNTSILSHLLAVSTDVVTSTAITNTSLSKLAPRSLQAPTGKFLPGKHRKRRQRQISIVEEECAEIAEEDEKEEEEDENDELDIKTALPSVSFTRRGSGGSNKMGHVYSAGILSTEPVLHSSTAPLPIAPPGIQSNLLSVRRRSSDRSSNSSRSSDGAIGAKIGSPDRGTNSPKTPAPFPITSQIGSGSLSRQGSLNRGRTSDRSAATSHSSTPNSVSERSSPSSPPGSNTSSNHSSPVARTRINLSATGGGMGIGVITGTGRQHKLVATRSSPQLMHHATQPALKEIHEECEDTGSLSAAGSITGSPVTILSEKGDDKESSKSVQLDKLEDLSIVDAFPATREGAAVLRRLEQRRKLRMHQARAASCSSSEASEDEAGSSNSGKIGKPISSGLLQKGGTTLARISERPHSSPGTSQRSARKRHGMSSSQTTNSESEEQKLSPFHSACTQPQLRKGRENSNQDDSSDNQDSGAPYCKGKGSSRLFVAEKGFDNSTAEEKQSQESKNTGNQNTRPQNHCNKQDSKCTGNVALNDDMSSLDISESDEKTKGVRSRSVSAKNDTESIRTNKSSRNASIDSAEDSGDWEDLESFRFLPELSSRDEYFNESRIQLSVDDSSPSSLEFLSKSPSPKSSSHSRLSLKSATSGFPILRQRLAKIQEDQVIADDARSRIKGSGIESDLGEIGEESDIEADLSDQYDTASFRSDSLEGHSLYSSNSEHRLYCETNLKEIEGRESNVMAGQPSKYQIIKRSVGDKPLYRAHSCGSLFSMHNSNTSGLITVRHRRLSSQLCLPVDSISGINVSSTCNSGRPAHVTATVFIDIYAPYSPASPTLTGSPASSPSSGDDMLSFKGYTRSNPSNSNTIPVWY